MLTNRDLAFLFLHLLLSVGDQNTIVPALYKYLLVRSYHLSIAMLLVLRPSPNILRSIRCCECPFAIFHIVLPLPLVFIAFSGKKLSFTVALACLPMTNVKVLVVVVALPMAIA